MNETESKPLNTPKGFKYLDRPMVVRRAETTHYLWGDEESGQVNDIIYGRNERIGCVIFTLPPGGRFTSSKVWKTLNDQHRFYYVVQGQLTIHDPQSGEVAVAEVDEAIHWRGNRWHFAYNCSQQETIILDWYAPHNRPLRTVLGEYGKTKPDLEAVHNGRYDLIGKWPAAMPETRAKMLRDGAPVTIRRSDALHLIHGDKNPSLESLYISTEELTAGVVNLSPGVKTDAQSHPGEKILVVLKGRLNVYLPDSFEWFEVHAMDLLYLPRDIQHHYWNYSGAPVEFAFFVVPRYR